MPWPTSPTTSHPGRSSAKTRDLCPGEHHPALRAPLLSGLAPGRRDAAAWGFCKKGRRRNPSSPPSAQGDLVGWIWYPDRREDVLPGCNLTRPCSGRTALVRRIGPPPPRTRSPCSPGKRWFSARLPRLLTMTRSTSPHTSLVRGPTTKRTWSWCTRSPRPDHWEAPPSIRPDNFL